MKKKEDEEWRAEDDARLLMEYQKLYKDKKRMENAKEKLKERKKDIEKALSE